MARSIYHITKHRRKASCRTALSITNENNIMKYRTRANMPTYLNNFVLKWLRRLTVLRVTARVHCIQTSAQSIGDNLH